MQQPGTGFFSALMDFSFTSFVTSKIIRVLYALAIVGAAVVGLSLILSAFARSPGTGLVTLLIFAPLVFLLIVTYARVVLELVIVIFRISEHAAEIAQQGRRGPAQP